MQSVSVVIHACWIFLVNTWGTASYWNIKKKHGYVTKFLFTWVVKDLWRGFANTVRCCPASHSNLPVICCQQKGALFSILKASFNKTEHLPFGDHVKTSQVLQHNEQDGPCKTMKRINRSTEKYSRLICYELSRAYRITSIICPALFKKNFIRHDHNG